MKDKKNKKKNKPNRFNSSALKGTIPVTEAYLSELRRKANYYYEKEDFEEALDYFLTLKQKTDDFSEYDLLAFCYYETEDYENALKLFLNEYEVLCQEYEEEKNDDIFVKKDIFFNKICKSYLKSENFNGCIDFCSQIQENDKLYKEKLPFLIQSYLGLNNGEKFKEYFNILNEKYPNNENYKSEILEYAVKIESPHRFEIIKSLEGIQISTDLFYDFLKTCNNESIIDKISYCENYIKAIVSNDYIIKHYFYTDEIEMIIDKFTEFLYFAGEYEKMLNYIEIFNKIIEKNEIETNVGLYSLLNLVLLSIKAEKLNQTEETVLKYTHIEDKNYSRTYYLLAIIYYFKRDYEKAYNYYEKVLESIGYKNNIDDSQQDDFDNWISGFDELADFTGVLIRIKKDDNLPEFEKKIEILSAQENKSGNISIFGAVLNKLLTYIYILNNDYKKIKKCERIDEKIRKEKKSEYDELFSIPYDEKIIDNLIILCAKNTDFMIY